MQTVFFKLLTRTLTISLTISLMLHIIAVGQGRSTLAVAKATGGAQGAEPLVIESDSLLAKRSFFTTAIMHQGKPLGSRAVIELMDDDYQVIALFRRGQLIKPVGPLLIASGIIIGYLAVKGTTKTAYARAIGTPANPSPPDVLVQYTSRSLPVLVGGIGLLVGGLCLIEISNGVTAKSINLYNSKLPSQRSVSSLKSIKLGLTSGGNVGLEANF